MTWLSSLQLGFDSKQINLSTQRNSNRSTVQTIAADDTNSAKTRLCHRLHTGALMVQRPLYPEPVNDYYQQGICHIYVLYPPAGIADGDFLTLDFNLSAGSHAVITTPGAGKWYGHRGRKNDSTRLQQSPNAIDNTNTSVAEDEPREIRQTEGAKQTITAHLADNTILEWLPQESIYYDYSFSDSVNRFELSDSASLLTWDISVFGRRAYDEHFNSGHYGNRLRIARGKKVLVSEHTSQPADSPWFNSVLGLNGQHVQGSFWAVPSLANISQSNPSKKQVNPSKSYQPDMHRKGQYLDETIQRIRELIDEHDLPIVCTHNFESINCRYIGADVRACFEAFYQVRELLRQFWYGLEPHRPRIWDT